MSCVNLDSVSLVEGLYELVPLRYEDIFQVADWRNAQMEVLRQKEVLTKEMQEQYYEDVVLPSLERDRPSLVLFSFLCEGQCIGYGGLVYIDWDAMRSEVSFLVDPQRAKEPSVYGSDFSNYLKLIKRYAFTELGLNRLFTETFSFRKEHIVILEQEGFLKEGCLRQHVSVRGSLEDSLMHGILKEDYEA